MTIFRYSGDNRKVNVASVIDYIIHHNVEIIQWTVVAICITTAGFIAWVIFRPSSPSSGEDVSDLKQALKEVLEQTKGLGASTSAVSAPATSSENAKSETPESARPAAPLASVEDGKQKELEAQIAQLKSDLENAKSTSAAAGGTSSAETGALTQKIEELEARLAEYEILEDDIADLSMYKEENEKLKKQLAEKGLSGAEDQGASTSEASGENSEDLVAEFAAAVSQEKDQKEETSADPSLPDELTSQEPEKIATDMEELLSGGEEAPVEEPPPSKEDDAPVEEPPSKEEKPPEEEPPAPNKDEVPVEEPLVPTEPDSQQVRTPAFAPQPESNSEKGAIEVAADDLMAEFERSLSEDSGSSSTGAGAQDPLSSGLDTDKVLEEMAGLAEVDQEASGSALEEEVDTDKMAAEALNLHSEG